MSFNFPLTARPAAFTNEGSLNLNPSLSSSPSDYDFLQGHHSVRHKKLKERLNGCTEWIDIEGLKITEKILGGAGNVERHWLKESDGKQREAVALRLFNLSAKLWSLYWADSLSGTLDPPMHGSFEDNFGVFFGKDYFKGEEILVQFQYDRTHPEKPVWG